MGTKQDENLEEESSTFDAAVDALHSSSEYDAVGDRRRIEENQEAKEEVETESESNTQLNKFVWMTRRLPKRAGAVLLGGYRIYAGDWDGLIIGWDSDGEEEWRCQTPDRVESLAGSKHSNPPRIHSASGASILCVAAATGEVLWEKELVGSSDMVRCLDDGSIVVATSSVYDIEHSDFMESACWRFDGDGVELRADELDERPWHIVLDEEGVAVLGLGRPLCGIWVQDKEGGRHIQDEESDPVLSGDSLGERTLLGCSSGAVKVVEGRGSKTSVRTLNHIGQSSVNALVVMEDGGHVHGDSLGVLRCSDEVGNEAWSLSLGEEIEHIVTGFLVEGHITLWVTTYGDTNNRLHVVNSEAGTLLLSFELSSRATTLAGRESRVAIGLEDGQIHVFEQELFGRRWASEDALHEEQVGDDAHRSEMVEKLRRLRGI